MNLPIPLNGHTPLIKPGDIVTVGQLIAKKQSASEQVINLSLALGVPAHTVQQYLKKNPGDSIAVGDVIAQKKGLLRGGEKIVSKIAGIVIRFERNSGELVIRGKDGTTEEQIHAPIDGKVTVCNNEQIVLENDQQALVGITGFGKIAEGQIHVLPKKESVGIYDLTPESIDTIIVGTLFHWDVIVKAIGMGAKGIIASDLGPDAKQQLATKEITMPIVVVSTADLQNILKWHTRKVLLDGAAKTITELT